jgi:hypothetical protein
VLDFSYAESDLQEENLDSITLSSKKKEIF